MKATICFRSFSSLLLKALICGMLLILFGFSSNVFGQEGSAQAVVQAGTDTPTANQQTQKAKLDVTWDGKLLTLDVVDTDVSEVMKAISGKSGVEVQVYEGVTG